MKKLSFLFLILLALFISSCHEEDGTNDPQNGQEQEVEQDQEQGSEGEGQDEQTEGEEEGDENGEGQEEEEEDPVALIESGISIEGATIESGTPPAPNSNIDFQINTDEQEAFQGSSLSVLFSSSDPIVGAYILLKDAEGNPLDGYFDVPVSSTISSSRVSETHSRKSISPLSKSAILTEEFENEINFNLANTVPPGQFCYDICLYDAANNISQIQTVCVTIASWGGNASIVGRWVLDYIDQGDDIEQTIFCDSGEEISGADQIFLKNDWTFVLNDDGTYYEIFDQELEFIDIPASESDCAVIYSIDTEIIHDRYDGNWSYNQDEGTLTAIDFRYEDLNSMLIEEYESGQIYLNGVGAEIVSDQLVLTYDFETKVFFNRE